MGMHTKRVSALEVSIWITLVIFILLAFSPYIIGYKAKNDYTRLINQLSEISRLDLQVANYSQGFFSSQATLSLKLPDYSEKILFKEEIVHGPVYIGLISQGKSPFIAAVINGELDVQSVSLANIKKLFSGTNPVLYQHLIDFNGNVDSQVYMPAMKTLINDDVEPVSLESSGAIYTQFISSADGSVKGELNMPSFKINKSTFDMLLKNSVVSFSGKKGINQLMMGDSVVSVGRLNIDSADEQFAVKKLIVHSLSSEEGQFINTGAQISAREVLASNQKFGPVAMNFSLNSLDITSLLQLEKLQASLEQQQAQGASEEKINSIMFNQLAEVMPILLQNAEANINPLSINSELGRLEADMHFKMDGLAGQTSIDPVTLLDAIKFNLNISIDEALIRKLFTWYLENTQDDDLSSSLTATTNVNAHVLMSKKVDDNLNALMDINWLVKDENVYLSKISMQQGALLVNDINIDAMQQIMSSVSGEYGSPVQ